jgi:hypothetical protein
VKQSGGLREKEGEREKEISGLMERERQSIEQKWKWHGSEMAIREIEHLSVFSNANLRHINEVTESWRLRVFGLDIVEVVR